MWFYIILLISVLIVLYLRRTFSYWECKNITSYPAPSYIFGNMTNSISMQITEFYKYFKSKGLKHGGFYFFHQPIFMPIDPDLLKSILTKDFDHFTDKGLYSNERDQPINMHLFQIGGERWCNLRVKLTPTFTSGKLKNMFAMIADCTAPLVDQVAINADNGEPVDIKDFASKYTTDVIGNCAFGIDCNSFTSTESAFHRYGKRLFAVKTKTLIKRAMFMSFPRICRFLRMVPLSKDINEFYTSITAANVAHRLATHERRNDFLQLLIEMMSHSDEAQRIDVQEIINQSFIFYVAGYETSSSVMTFALLELARNTDVQELLRAEICAVLQAHNGEMSYDAIQEMKYLAQVVDETLRMYPPLVILNRECSKDYRIPGTDEWLEAGTKVFIPVLPLQLDDDHYPNAEEFDPERFDEANRAMRHPYTFLPFGEGPRQCIGLRFGLLQTKIGLVSLLIRFRFEFHASVKYPIEYSNAFLALAPNQAILLNVQKL